MARATLDPSTATGPRATAKRSGREGKSMPRAAAGHHDGFAHHGSAVAPASTRDRADAPAITDEVSDRMGSPLAAMTGSAAHLRRPAVQAGRSGLARRAATTRQNPARPALRLHRTTRAVATCRAMEVMGASRVLWGSRRRRAVRCSGIFEKTAAFFDLPSPSGRHLDALNTPALEPR